MSLSVPYRHELSAVLCLAVLLCLPWLERPFHTRGEPREVLVAQAMLISGNWISPETYDQSVPSKPPFSHWFMALFSLPFGEVTELTASLPSAISFLVFLGGFFNFVARRTSVSIATSASIILMTMGEWFRSASTCRVDMILASSMAGALLCLYGWWERKYRGVPWLALGLAVCATLTKGPVGLVLPVSTFSLFCWSREGLSPKALPAVVARAVALTIPVLMISSAWYVLAYLQRGEVFLDKVVYENFDRFTSSMEDRPHSHSVAYLMFMLALGALPWTVCWGGEVGARMVAYAKAPAAWRKSSIYRSLTTWWQDKPPLYQFSILVIGSITLFFCIPTSKRGVYLLPTYPFIALVCASMFGSEALTVARTAGLLRRVIVWVALLGLGLTLVLFFTSVMGFGLRTEFLVSSITPFKVIAILIPSALLCGPLRRVLRAWSQRPSESLGISMVFAVAVLSLCAYDTIAWQLSPKSWVLSSNFQARLPRSHHTVPFYSYGSEMYGASFYLQRPLKRLLGGLPEGESLVMLEAERLEKFRREVAPTAIELFRYHSGLEASSEDIVVVRVESTTLPAATDKDSGKEQ